MPAVHRVDCPGRNAFARLLWKTLRGLWRRRGQAIDRVVRRWAEDVKRLGASHRKPTKTSGVRLLTGSLPVVAAGRARAGLRGFAGDIARRPARSWEGRAVRTPCRGCG